MLAYKITIWNDNDVTRWHLGLLELNALVLRLLYRQIVEHLDFTALNLKLYLKAKSSQIVNILRMALAVGASKTMSSA